MVGVLPQNNKSVGWCSILEHNTGNHPISFWRNNWDHYLWDKTRLGSFFPPLLQEFALKYLILISSPPPQIHGSTSEPVPACSLNVCRLWVFPKVDADTLRLHAHLCLLQSYFSPASAPFSFSFSVASEPWFLYHPTLSLLPSPPPPIYEKEQQTAFSIKSIHTNIQTLFKCLVIGIP